MSHDDEPTFEPIKRAIGRGAASQANTARAKRANKDARQTKWRRNGAKHPRLH